MSDYLTHHGILGMKWGVRRTPAQLGRTMTTRKRQLAADKSDLKKLNSGKHTSVGVTKKRQAAYDKRDKDILEKRIKSNEQKSADKLDKKDKDFKFVDDEVAQMPQKKQNAFLNYQKLVGSTRDNIDDPELYELIRLEFEDACERGIIDVNKSWESNEKAIRRDATKVSHQDSKNSLYHHGILGMKWGVRRSRKQLDRLAGRARSVESEAKTAKKLATAYTNAIDKRAAKKPSSVARANEAKTAHKIADNYVNAMNKKATKARTKATTLDKKTNPVKYMSDAELRSRLNRLQMERQYSQLSKSSVSKGKEYAQKVFKAGTTVAAVTTTALTIHNNVGKIKKIITKG